MGYRIIGRFKGRKFRSKSYPTEDVALRAGYKMVYKKDGTTKRKASAALTSWYLEKD